MKNAVIVVHGISPHQRYQIQDAFASGLCSALQAETARDRTARLGAGAPKGAGFWSTGIVWPRVHNDQQIVESQAVALRVECKDEGGGNIPFEPTIDVFEGYWSPIDKEQTTPLRVLSWLLAATFVPLNNVRIPATFAKSAFDLSFTLGALVLGLLATYVVASSALRAYHAYVTQVSVDMHGLLFAAVGAYMLAQVLARLWQVMVRHARLSVWNALILVGLAIGGVILLDWPNRAAQLSWIGRLTGPSGWLFISALALRFVLSFAKNFLVDAIGDIQIYTTHDENARFYQFRQQIIQTVGRVVVQVLQSTDEGGKPLYDNVFLVGHSLGTTVLMDVIIALHALVEEEAFPTERWRCIRAFVTYGSALEKTRFFFDVRNQNLSEALVRWRKDVYGHLFTADAAVLDGEPPRTHMPPSGIFWANYWYFTDVVANEIRSYTSSREPGEDLTGQAQQPDHSICVNVQLQSPRTILPHSRYLRDASFWHTGPQHRGAAAIVAHG
ncbi:MAG: hypothetical protein M3Z41_01840 [Candidatus Eremiobacteraeota bacterium]|nr:hypothetical protein [Candidatus Eremiobacteraeota bacterium]